MVFLEAQTLRPRKGLAYMKRLGAQEFRLYSGLTIITGLLAAASFAGAQHLRSQRRGRKTQRRAGGLGGAGSDLHQVPTHRVAAKAPHPNAAKLFVDFMLSEEGQRIIASFGRVPIAAPCRPTCRDWTN